MTIKILITKHILKLTIGDENKNKKISSHTSYKILISNNFKFYLSLENIYSTELVICKLINSFTDSK